MKSMTNKYIVILFAILFCFSIPIFAQSAFTRNDNYDFAGKHVVTASGNRPDDFNITVETNSDFRNFKLLINWSRLSIGHTGSWWWANRYRVDMNNDGTWEKNWTSDNEITITYLYPDPPNGISADYTIKVEIEYTNAGGGTYPRTKYIPITIFPSPAVYANTENDAFIQLRNEDATNKIPVVLVEGFDPTNEKFPELYYRLTWDLVNTDLYPNGYEIFILNFHDGGRDLRQNADVLLKAIEKIHEVCPNYKIVIGGLSMGGPITRYALAKKENLGKNHNVGLFMSYDSPQERAHVSPGLQDWIKDQSSGDEAIRIMQDNLKSVAAKQMLWYNTYDPTHILSNEFYDELNSLNGDGYPHKSYNVSVSNGNLNATWGYGSVGRHLLTLKINDELIHDVAAVELDCGAGSKMTDITTKRYGDIFSSPFFSVYYEMQILFNPAYIPTWSGLDLVDYSIDPVTGNITSFDHSKFDDYAVQTTPLQHHELSTVTRNKISTWLNKDFSIGINYTMLEGGSANSDNYPNIKILHGASITANSKNVTVNGKQVTYNFLNWEDGNTNNPRIFYSSPNENHTATMKGRLISSTPQATAGNGRKIVTDGNSIHYAVYASAGSIWFLKSTDVSGTNWTNEIKIGDGKNPAIAIASNNEIRVVWENTTTSPKEVYYRRSTDGGVTWYAIETISSTAQVFDATPVALASSHVRALWRGAEKLYASIWYSAQGIFIPSQVPVLSSAQLPCAESVSGSDDFLVAYKEGDAIKIGTFGYQSAGPYVYNVSAPTQIATSSTANYINPTMCNDGSYVAWEDATNHTILLKEVSTGIMRQFSHGTHQLSNPSLCGYPLYLVFQCGSHIGESFGLFDGSWTPMIDRGTGIAPTAPAYFFDNYSDFARGVAVKGNSIPYAVDLYEIPTSQFSISGTLYSSDTWGGIVNVTGTVTVNSGVTLTINPGTVLLFANGASLIVNGTLNAVGTATNHIVFDRSGTSGTWGGIRLNSSSSTVAYCNISNAAIGVYAYNSSPSIHHNTISTGGYGIECYSSSATIHHNTITGQTSGGVYCTSNSSPMLGEPMYPVPGPGHNIIKGNSIGAVIVGNSYPVFGNGIIAGYNCIHNNSLSMYAMYTGNIRAENCWWNGTPNFSLMYGPSVDWTPALSGSDPHGCSGSMQKASGEISATPPSGTNDEELNALLLSEMSGKSDDAITGYVARLKKETNKETKKYLLVRLAECFRKGEKKDFAGFLNKDIRPSHSPNDELYATTVELENHFLIQEGKYEKALENCAMLITRFSKKPEIVKYALFNSGYLSFFVQHDSAQGMQFFNTLKKDFPEDELTWNVKLLFGEVDSAGFKGFNKQGTQLEIAELPTEYALNQNYPNPFNPSTTIDYQIPNAGNVSLKVYDMLGREVTQLVNEYKPIGRYTVTFDGSHLASGSYVVRMQSEKYTKTMKMMLVK